MDVELTLWQRFNSEELLGIMTRVYVKDVLVKDSTRFRTLLHTAECLGKKHTKELEAIPCLFKYTIN
ncbi:hypothetical protein [Photobacterium angustum]|nr:hypothetical protein [Photobacterium angustum]